MKLAIYCEQGNPVGKALEMITKTLGSHEPTIVCDESALYDWIQENQYQAMIMVSVANPERNLSLAKAVRKITGIPIYNLVVKEENLEDLTSKNIRTIPIMSGMPDLIALLAEAEKNLGDRHD